MSHLEDINMSYFKHLSLSLNYSFQSFYAGFVFIFHGFFPNYFVNKGSSIIFFLNARLDKNQYEINKNKFNTEAMKIAYNKFI